MGKRDEGRKTRPDRNPRGCGSCWACFCLVPWVPLASCVVLAVGIPLWWVYYGKLRDGTMAALADANVSQSFTNTVTLWTWRAHAAAVALIAITIATAVIMVVLTTFSNVWLNRGVIKRRTSPGPKSLRCCMMLDGLLVVLLWLLALCFVVLFGVYLVWLALVYVAVGALNVGMSYTTDLETTLRNALSSGSNLLTKIQGDINNVINQVPAPFVADVSSIVSQVQQIFDQQRALLSQSAPNNPCNASCVDVGFFVELGALQNPCLCVTSRLQQVQTPLTRLTNSGDAVPVVVGQGLLYIATSWLVMSAVASFVKASRDLLHQRHARALEQENAALATTMPIMGAPAANVAMARDQHPNGDMYKDLEEAHHASAANDTAPLRDGSSSSYPNYAANGGVNGQFGSAWNTRTNPIGAFSLQNQ